MSEKSIQHYSIEDGKYGKRLIPHGAWNESVTEIALSAEIAELELNYAKGWIRDDLSFLKHLGHLKSFRIADYVINDVSAVHYLSELREIDISTYCKTAIDFTRFPYLETCSLDWRPKAKSVFDCISLKHLCISRYKGKDTAVFGKLVNLALLRLQTAPFEDLSGLAPLMNLKELEIAYFSKLTSLRGLEALVQLELFRAGTCRKIRDIAPIANLVNLVKLGLSNGGAIETLRPVKNLRNLREIFFTESTNVLDGDMTVLINLPKLERLGFMNRKHYTHTCQEIEAMIAQRHKLNGTS